jgi:hypothetical protein
MRNSIGVLRLSSGTPAVSSFCRLPIALGGLKFLVSVHDRLQDIADLLQSHHYYPFAMIDLRLTVDWVHYKVEGNFNGTWRVAESRLPK